MEGLGNASSNSYVLKGFSEIAYGVYVVDHDADAAASVNDVSSIVLKWPTLRLRNAERRLRSLSFLVSLDHERGNLWLFLSKKEIEENGQNAIARAETDLRYAGCRPAVPVGSTVKASDILLERNTQLRKLFISAVLALVGRTFKETVSAIPLNARTFFVPQNGEFHASQPITALPRNHAVSLICSVNIELHPDGLVWVTTESKPCATVRQLSKMLHNGNVNDLSSPLDIWLGPFGRLATCNHTELANQSLQLSSPSTAANQSLLAQTKESTLVTKSTVWKRSVCSWLAVHGFDNIDLDNDQWLTVEVFVKSSMKQSQDHRDIGSEAQDQHRLEKFLWPSSLCVTRAKPPQDDEGIEFGENTRLSDPLKFAEDWYNDTGLRSEAIGKKKAARIARQLQQDQAKTKDISTEEEISDSFNVFPRPSQDPTAISGIYPTPPDGALSQATPGPPFEPSFDTPEEIESAAHADRRDTMGSQDRSVGPFEGRQANANVAAASYDEDLFEDPGGADFVAEEITDEPDWDFFNEPDKGPTHIDDVPMEDAPDIVFVQTADGDIKAEDLVPKDAMDFVQHGQGGEAFKTPETKAMSAESPNRPKSQSLRTHLPPSSSESQTASYPRPAHTSNSLTSDSSKTSGPHRNDKYEKEQLDDQQSGSYQKIPKQKIGELQDDKYGASGRFWFAFEDYSHNEFGNNTIQSAKCTDLRSPLRPKAGSVQTRKSAVGQESDPCMALNRSFSHQSSTGSDYTSDSSDSYPLPEIATTDRPGLSAREEVYTNSPTDVQIDKQSASKFLTESFNLLELLQTDASEWSIVDLLGNPVRIEESEQDFPSEDHLKIAQLTVDQITQSSFQACSGVDSVKQSAFVLQSVSKDMQRTVFSCDSLSIQELAATTDPFVGKIETPRIQVKRENEFLQALTSILPFWEAFSLEPANGGKDVRAICIYPDQALSSESASNFLGRIEHAYNSCHLGSHSRSMAPPISDGLLPWKSKEDWSVQSLNQTCEAAGRAITSDAKAGATFVVYVINPFPAHQVHSKVDICAAFLRLFKSYVNSKLSSSPQDIDIALQIVPLSFVQSPDTVLIVSQRAYHRLATEVYNRCPPTKRTDNFAACGSAVKLASPVAKQLTFTLSDVAESPFRLEEKLLHVSYCQTPDERWIAASWSDSSGCLALTMSYCLYYKRAVVYRQRAEIIKEIWETSLDIAKASEQARKYRWRLIVVKDCPIEPEELNEWNVLLQSQVPEITSGASPMAVTHVTMRTRPPLKLRVGSSTTSSTMQYATTGNQNTPQQGNVTTSTPVSTPTNSQPVLSPEQLMFSAPTPASTGASLGNAPTPPAPEHAFEIDTDSVLINPDDESEYLMLPPARSINNSHSILDYRPAKQSAYIFQRISPAEVANQGWLGIGVDVNLVQTTQSQPLQGNGLEEKSDEGLLKDILLQYRGLVTIAKTRGMVAEREGILLPWHLETAMRACNVLSVFP